MSSSPKSRTHLSHAIGKEEAYVVLNFPKQGHCLKVIFLRLTTKASNEITAEAHTCDTRQMTACHCHSLPSREAVALGDFRGRASDYTAFPELFITHVASETEQSIQSQEGHDCSSTRFPSQSLASQSTFPSASYQKRYFSLQTLD